MNGIFVDTGGWYAAIDRKDRDHEAARRFLENNSLPLITTDYVMDETDLASNPAGALLCDAFS